jgi:hypothetical protein
MTDFDLDRAFRVYLGGPSDAPSLNFKNGEKRLSAEFGQDAPKIKMELDRIVDEIVKPAQRKGLKNVLGGRSLASWIAEELPSLSNMCRQKIETYVQINVAR